MAKLLGRGKKDWSDLSAPLYAELVDTLYGPMASLLAGVAGGPLCAAVTAWATGSVALAVLSAVMLYVGLCRVVLVAYYRRRAGDASRETTRRWELAYGAGAWGFSSCLGLVCWFAVTGTPDAAVHLLVATFTVGYTASIAGRNAGRPALVAGQILLATLPLGAALVVHGGAMYVALAGMLVVNFFSVKGIARQIHGILFRALDASERSDGLARELTVQNRLFDVSMNSMSHGLCVADAEGNLRVWNRRFSDLFGLGAEETRVGAPVARLVSSRVCAGSGATLSRLETLEAFSASLRATVRSTVELTLDGGTTCLMTFDPMAEGGMVVVIEDVTDRRRVEERLRYMARFDPLTDLPNRASLVEALNSITARRAPKAALLLVDLDHFKQVNDTLGHPVGDQILRDVSDRLRLTVGTAGTVARFGGDEFAIILDGCGDRGVAEATANAVIAAVSDIYEVADNQMVIGATVGMAMVPADGLASDQIMKKADMALYAAKDRGRGTCKFFDADMDMAAQVRRQLDVGLRSALARGQMELAFQPLYSLESHRISAFEALARWHHPERGMVAPAEFIPAAEETGTIRQIGDWVLAEACRVAAGWPPDVRIAVNLSPVQFRFPNLVQQVADALARSGLAPGRLELEITESVLTKDTEATLAVLGELRAMGVLISLDDFGKGFSSLGYLRKFPFSKVKMDREFVMEITDPNASSSIVRAVAMIADEFGMTLAAEGIETAAQLQSVLRDGCTEGQGYFLDRPLTEAEANDRILAAGSPFPGGKVVPMGSRTKAV